MIQILRAAYSVGAAVLSGIGVGEILDFFDEKNDPGASGDGTTNVVTATYLTMGTTIIAGFAVWYFFLRK